MIENNFRWFVYLDFFFDNSHGTMHKNSSESTTTTTKTLVFFMHSIFTNFTSEKDDQMSFMKMNLSCHFSLSKQNCDCPFLHVNVIVIGFVLLVFVIFFRQNISWST